MSDPLSLAFVDCRTTGLDPRRHEVWEVGLILRYDDGPGAEVEFEWQLPVDLSRADLTVLDTGGFFERRDRLQRTIELDTFALEFMWRTKGAHLVGAVPSFDASFLSKLLLEHGALPAWHCHLVDVEALAAGKLGVAPPWDSNELSRAVGVNPDDFARHTALGDARWARAIYDAVVRS